LYYACLKPVLNCIQATVNLLTATIKMDADDTAVRLCACELRTLLKPLLNLKDRIEIPFEFRVPC
jgi:hypothetical protein